MSAGLPSSPSAELLIAELQQRGILLWLEGDRLRCSGPDEALTDATLALLKSRREALVSALRATPPESSAQPGRIDRAPRAAALPLSFAQQRLWFMEQMPQEAGVYNIPLAVRIDGYLDAQALGRALDAIVARHEILRTRFVNMDGEPRQQIDAPSALQVGLVDVADDADVLRRHIVEFAATPFDLERDAPLRVQLLRLSVERHILCLTVHHIACDGWSLDVLMAELGACYRAAMMGRDADLPPLPVQYADFAIWQRARLTGAVLDAQADYWRRQLAGPLPVLELPTDFARARLQTHDGAVAHFRLPTDLVERLRALGRAHSASLFMTLLAAFKVLLFRCTGQRDVIVGAPVANRQQAELEGLIGLFVNTLVLRTTLDPTQGFDSLLDAVRRTTLDGLAHQDLPFEKLIEVVQPERDLSRNPLFQVKFRLENAAPEQSELPGLVLKRLPQAVISAKLDLSMDLYETADGIVGGLEYNSSLFAADTMARMAGHFETLLRAIADAPTQPLATLSLLTPAQRQQQLVGWNNTARDWRRDTCFHWMFEEAATAHPDVPALVFDGPPAQQLSYAELNARSNQLAHWLRAHGVGPEIVVGICLDRSLDMIVAMLAVLKAGGAYLPLDANYPPERLAFMLADARVPVLLSASAINLPAAPLRLDLDTSWPTDQPAHNPARVNDTRHLAYVIYTSGSTGLPKGVMIEHSGLVNLTEDKIRVCDVRADDCVLQFFSFSFDASIPEIIMPLAIGARLLLAPAATLLPGPALASLIDRHGVTHVTMTPSALVGLPDGDYPSLRMVLVGGEAPSAELMTKWTTGGRVFINAYGPTETTVNASMVYCGNGHPLAATLAPSTNKQLYVLDDGMQLLPVGAPGELHIGGVGLARGYLNRPDLTARQFVPNPFRDGDDASPCLYRTGDLACLLPDGRVRLLGRVDNQVKIRGFRVEPGDIEHAITQHPAVKAAVVIAIDDAHQGRHLAAFVVAHEANPPAPAEIRQQLGERLPHYMVPASLRWLDSLPLTPNGKIDTAALAELGRAAPVTSRTPPRNDTEAQMAAVFADVLGIEQIGIEDDFFGAGGHSLLATRLVAQLLKLFDVEITVIDLFEAPTVMALAQRVEHKQKMARLQTSAGTGEEREEIEL